MTKKRTSILLFLFVMSILLVGKFLFFSDHNTTITIENLEFFSNDNPEHYHISRLEPHTEVSFKYELGGFNENTAGIHHMSDLGDINTYSITGYLDRSYSSINIEIISISNGGELNIKIDK